MIQLITAMTLFTGIVVLLAAVVLLARRALVPEQAVTISVNRQRTFTTTSGERLLRSLAEAGILLPAACGGRGSCGQCRVRVTGGGGPMLPIETEHLTRHDAAAGARLACMVTVYQDLTVEVPPPLLAARPWRCSVVAVRWLAPLLKELTLTLEADVPMRYLPGDWVLLHAPRGRVDLADVNLDPRYRSDWESLRGQSLEIAEDTRRAYSLASHPGEVGIIRLVIRLATPPPTAPAGAPCGQVSSYAFTLPTGASVTLSGPFGSFHLRDTDAEKIFIGGGAGIAPMRSMILHLLNGGGGGAISFWYGARNRREICYQDEFTSLDREHPRFSYHVGLSDPGKDEDWEGATGFIHQVLLDQYLHDHPAPEEAEYYLCGPPVMRRAVITMLEDLGVDRSSILFDDFGG